MELLIKLYHDKPSRIGIKYSFDYLALRPYEYMVSRHKNESFSMTLEPVKDRMNLVLKSDESGIKYEYKMLEYKKDQIDRLQVMTSTVAISLLFVHVYPKSNQLVVARPFRQQTFINVSRLEFIALR